MIQVLTVIIAYFLLISLNLQICWFECLPCDWWQHFWSGIDLMRDSFNSVNIDAKMKWYYTCMHKVFLQILFFFQLWSKPGKTWSEHVCTASGPEGSQAFSFQSDFYSDDSCLCKHCACSTHYSAAAHTARSCTQQSAKQQHGAQHPLIINMYVYKIHHL